MGVQIMGILNMSPDSFNGDGVATAAELEARLRTLINDGADIIDIGGQSTRPGAETITAEEELRRVLPAITAARRMCDVPISVDTFTPHVAEAALAAGARILNDVHGFADERLVAIARKFDASVIVMHSRGDAVTMQNLTEYPNGIMAELHDFFRARTAALIKAGIARERITIDPGIGFAKTAAQCFEVTRDLRKLTTLGFPVLYAASQKSFIGKALADAAGNPAPPEDRQAGTLATAVYAMVQGASMVRVHDVRLARQARTIVEAIQHPERVKG